jgi:hypothetical protein
MVKLFTRARERIIPGPIKMVIKLIPRISDGRYSLGAVSFHPASKYQYTPQYLLYPGPMPSPCPWWQHLATDVSCLKKM